VFVTLSHTHTHTHTSLILWCISLYQGVRWKGIVCIAWLLKRVVFTRTKIWSPVNRLIAGFEASRIRKQKPHTNTLYYTYYLYNAYIVYTPIYIYIYYNELLYTYSWYLRQLLHQKYITIIVGTGSIFFQKVWYMSSYKHCPVRLTHRWSFSEVSHFKRRYSAARRPGYNRQAGAVCI